MLKNTLGLLLDSEQFERTNRDAQLAGLIFKLIFYPAPNMFSASGEVGALKMNATV